jgi:hypothetical protein
MFGLPGHPQLSLPALPVPRLTRKMKRFHWNLIAPAAVQSSVWIDVATREITDDIDYAELEKLFSAETQEAKKLNTSMKCSVCTCMFMVTLTHVDSLSVFVRGHNY